ncbi:MAG TPA: YHYH protein [Ignavibacteria bacterium]|nr:YHYH protein [Ignavibacteria bacterium]
MIKLFFTMFLLSSVISFAQITPEIYSWKQNNSGVTGYNGILADVQQVFYSANYAYVKCTGIPSYTIGPWNMNPNLPTNQNWVFKITRFPVPAATPVTAGNGQIGVLINGVVLFNAGDAMSYNNQNVWHRVAQYFEAVSFDTSGGHPGPSGSYHYHINMKKLYTPNPSQHSPILGYMFDGYPLYGPYGYSNTNGTGGIRRMKSGYKKRAITVRTIFPDGTVLPSGQWGLAVSATYPLGCFTEDYELNTAGTDLDSHNGRNCVTPEYPLSTYAYFITTDSLGNPVYPYIIGKTFNGTVTAGNVPPGGHNVISEPVTQYFSTGIRLKVYLQGFKNGTTLIPDSLKLYLRNHFSPYNITDSASTVQDSSGFGIFNFNYARTDSCYYLEIKHRNHMRTFSSVCQSLGGNISTYDFTLSSSKAFGNNLIYTPDINVTGGYAFYGGDVNQDGITDAEDVSTVENSVLNSESGYIISDLTGDYIADASDISITDNNSSLGITIIRP